MRPLAQLRHELLIADVMSTGHGPILGTRALHWPDEAACAAFAQSLARKDALRGAFIELHGPLGAGKTTFVRHLLRALGVPGRVKSPTYALLESYALPGTAVSHLDFYRFADAHEWVDAGLRDVFAAPGLKLVEWPTNAAGLLPLADLRFYIEPGRADQREVLVQAGTALGLQLLP
jgi:tRNA threonylcarbamoyladenosine biosynthesis protein TsaE